MNNPLISVIIPIYNGERFLAETIRSVLDQTYAPIEVIAVDDGSTDGSAAIVRSFPDVKYIHQSNQGVAAARNTGVKAAQGDFLAFIDQDDLWTLDKLEKQAAYLQEHADIGYVLSMVQFFLEPGVEKPAWVRDELLVEPRPGYNLGNVLIRRRVFERVGLFDTQYVLASDHDWFVRAKDDGIPMARMPDVMLMKRTHDSNESRHTSSRHELLAIHRASVRRQKSRESNHPTKDGANG
jgi:glycosyltransferase involved in cell wall biosynthesis